MFYIALVFDDILYGLIFSKCNEEFEPTFFNVIGLAYGHSYMWGHADLMTHCMQFWASIIRNYSKLSPQHMFKLWNVSFIF